MGRGNRALDPAGSRCIFGGKNKAIEEADWGKLDTLRIYHDLNDVLMKDLQTRNDLFDDIESIRYQ